MRNLIRATVVPVLRLILGRRNLARFARLLTMEARYDGGGDDIRGNGEMLFLRGALSSVNSQQPIVLFDVGANKGDWTACALEIAHARSLDQLRVIAFEPTPGTHALLVSRVAQHQDREKVSAVQMALSDHSGTATLHVIASGSGRNSLVASADAGATTPVAVACETVDAFAERERIGTIHFLKVDAEGHDLSVLRGAAGMLSRGAILFVQFEYNQLWIDSRAFLRDVFELLTPLGYRIGKITQHGVETYEQWDFELESWRQANFVAWARTVECPVKSEPWWNA